MMDHRCSQCQQLLAEQEIADGFCSACRQPNVAEADSPTEYEVVNDDAPAIIAGKSVVELVKATMKADAPDGDAVDEENIGVVEGEPAVEPATPRPRRKKKKAKRRASTSATHPKIPEWLIPTVSLGALVGALGIAGVVAMMSGPIGIILTVLTALTLVISVPVSCVILIGSMYVSSAIMGGIEFGDVRAVIPKALILLIILDLIYLIPIAGFIISAPLTLLGLMFLFRLDVWEARLLVGVNWIMNTIYMWIMLGTFVSFANSVADKAAAGMPEPPPPPNRIPGRRIELDMPRIAFPMPTHCRPVE